MKFQESLIESLILAVIVICLLIVATSCSTAPTSPPAPAIIYVPAQKLTQNPILSLQWDQNTEDDLVGYRVYSSNRPNAKSSGSIIASLDAVTLKPIDLEQTGDFYFQVTAVNADRLESDPSNEVRLIVPKLNFDVVTGEFGERLFHVNYVRLPPNPAIFYELQSSPDLASWTTEQNVIVTQAPELDQERVDAYFKMDKPAQFFRVKISYYKQTGEINK